MNKLQPGGLYVDVKSQADAAQLRELSMGMTADWPIAVEEGATLVRVGRAIFGERVMPVAGLGPA